MTLSAEQVRRLLDYDPFTGIFVRKVSRRGDLVGAVAGHRRSRDGRVIVHIAGHLHLASRLAWLWMTGEWPAAEIDHRDGDPSNNRWANLRAAARCENCRNIRKPRHNTSGFKGVYRHKARFRAAISVNDRYLHLGLFDTAEEAHRVYCEAADKHFGEFMRAA